MDRDHPPALASVPCVPMTRHDADRTGQAGWSFAVVRLHNRARSRMLDHDRITLPWPVRFGVSETDLADRAPARDQNAGEASYPELGPLAAEKGMTADG